MRTSDAAAFATAMGVLGEAFNEPVSDLRIEAYFDALSDLEFAKVHAAMRDSLKTCRFFPRPVEIRTAALGSTEDRAELGWAALMEAVRRVGYTGFPKFEDVSVMDTVKALWGSWGRLCESLPSDGPELIGWRKAFLSAYGTADRRLSEPSVKQLPSGLREALMEMAESKAMGADALRVLRTDSNRQAS